MATELKPMTINMGPQHPSTHGVLRLILELDGETVINCTPDIGYLHTGIEKTAENLNYNQAITVIDRMDYLSPLTNNLAYVSAVETLLDLEIPKRAQYLRVLFCELQRLASHLVWLGTQALDLGVMSMFFYCFREREEILDLLEMASGARMHGMFFRVGGLADDLPQGFVERLRHFLDDFPRWMDSYNYLLETNPLWLQRLKGTAPLTLDMALNYGVTGPSLRACGIEQDLRKTNPYSSYEDFEFEVPVGETGDAYDRYEMRIREMPQSVKIIRQALENLPEGGHAVDDWRIVPPPRDTIGKNMEALIYHFKLFTEGFKVPKGDTYAAVEGPRGEIGVYLVSDGSARPQRVRVRAPSFYNLQALPAMVRGQLVPDVVAGIGSIDIVLGDVDR